MRGPIQGLLDSHLAELVPDNIAWDAVPFDPVRGTNWYEPRLLGGPERILSLGRTPYLEQRGVYQIKVFAPASAMVVGAGAINELVDDLTGYFKAGLTLSTPGCTVHLLGNTVAPPLIDPRWYCLPVSVSYMAHYFA